jgi:hypothetical protein
LPIATAHSRCTNRRRICSIPRQRRSSVSISRRASRCLFLQSTASATRHSCTVVVTEAIGRKRPGLSLRRRDRLSGVDAACWFNHLAARTATPSGHRSERPTYSRDRSRYALPGHTPTAWPRATDCLTGAFQR